MNPPPLLSLPQEALREQVVATIRQHRPEPRLVENPVPVPPEQVEAMSRRVLDTMLTRQFRVGPLPTPDVYEKLLRRVRRCVSRNQPIVVTIGYGPLKNPHGAPYSRADWAEFFALTHLVAWHNKVQAVYAPGLRIKICFDDATLVMANDSDTSLMDSYMRSLPELVRALGYERIFIKFFNQSLFAWAFHCGFYLLARFRVWKWERDPAHRSQIERMDEYARRNVVVPDGLQPEEQERYLRRASHRYRVYWEALQLTRFIWGRIKVIAMYLDGSQHHSPQSVALHLTTLDKGQVTQPWQGEGVLLDNGRGKLEPFVLTAGRRPRHSSREVTDLDVVSCPAFDKIVVVAPLPADQNTACDAAPVSTAASETKRTDPDPSVIAS
jgi:hypothetical protein